MWLNISQIFKGILYLLLIATFPPQEKWKQYEESSELFFVIFYHSSNLALIIMHLLFRCKPNETILYLKQKVAPENWTFKVKEFHAISKACQAGAQMISQMAKGSYLNSP